MIYIKRSYWKIQFENHLKKYIITIKHIYPKVNFKIRNSLLENILYKKLIKNNVKN